MAIRAPSAIAASLAYTTSSVTRPHTGRGVEAAIGVGHHAFRISDGARDVFEPVGDNLRGSGMRVPRRRLAFGKHSFDARRATDEFILPRGAPR